jgi:hypothetical protein
MHAYIAPYEYVTTFFPLALEDSVNYIEINGCSHLDIPGSAIYIHFSVRGWDYVVDTELNYNSFCTFFFFFFSVSKFEIECLLGLYKAACSKSKMDRNRFRDFLHREFEMTDDILMDRGIDPICLFPKFVNYLLCYTVFKAFDKDNDSLVGPSEWVEGLSILLRGTVEEKIQCN